MFDNHTHTHLSNIRLLDSTNKPKQLIDKAIELGLSGVCITDHECVSAAIEVNKYAKKLRETNSNFTVGLGNEIYLVDSRDKGIKHYHQILIAKDAIGHKQIRELSSLAWINSYFDKGLERVDTLKEDLARIVGKNPGHVISTSACIGSELGTTILELTRAEKAENKEDIDKYKRQIIDYMKFCSGVFGEDFYIECAPACSKDQIIVNKRLLSIAKTFKVKMSIGSDSHFLRPENRYAHKAYLNSKGGEREVDSFYEYAHLMTENEARMNLRESFSDEVIDWIFETSEEIKNKIEFYSLERPQAIPEVEVTDYAKGFAPIEWIDKYPTLCSLISSDNIQERYWVNECIKSMQEKGLYHKPEYLERLEEEARVKRVVGERLGTCVFAYPNTLKHYIDLFWECGSTVGAGRGSSCAGLNHYLLGITQLDPIQWGLPWWRYLNDERIELPDIDQDLAPSKVQKIFHEIRAERGELGLVQVCTFGTETAKSAILTGARGYRSEKYPDGIDPEDAQYLSSLVPVERGFLWTIEDMVYGNQEKDRKPVTAFIHAVKEYPGLLDIIMQIKGLINKRSSHASGVIFFDEDIYETAAVMRTPNGALITQWDLHDQEAAGQH